MGSGDGVAVHRYDSERNCAGLNLHIAHSFAQHQCTFVFEQVFCRGYARVATSTVSLVLALVLAGIIVPEPIGGFLLRVLVYLLHRMSASLNTGGTGVGCSTPGCGIRPCKTCSGATLRRQCLPPEHAHDRRQIFQLIPSRSNVTYDDVWCVLDPRTCVSIPSHLEVVRRGTASVATYFACSASMCFQSDTIDFQAVCVSLL